MGKSVRENAMGAEAVLELADSLVFAATGKHLSDLQRTVLASVWQRQTYREIACRLRYTEGHIKDVASHLWQTLSQVLQERITKTNSLAVLERYLQQRSDLSVTDSLPVAQPPAPSQPSASFVGREAAIAQLHQMIVQGQRVVVVQGEGGIGKTTLAQQYIARQRFDKSLELLMAKETANITPVEQVVEEWLRQDFQIEPGKDFGVTLARLKRQLKDYRVGILIDNLEPALDGQGRFWPEHARYSDLLSILADPQGRTVTLLTSRDRLCEPGITVSHYRLPGLSVETWGHFFGQRQLTIADSTLSALHRAYGGNAKAMTILRSAIEGDFDRDGDAYWQDRGTDPLTTRDLKNLIASQVMRLKTLDQDAYRLFYRLGVFRYQDVAQVPTAGLQALMWDVDPARHHQVMTSLRNRSLVESYKGYYWLHPVVQAEALAHLRLTTDAATAHTQAMAFWGHQVPQITTITDAIQVFEGYYHALAIKDYEAAADVLLSSHLNQWGQYLTLGSTLYRMGLLQPVLQAIPVLLPHLPQGQRASELQNILADAYWISGNIHAAIATQTQARTLAQAGLKSALRVPVDAHQVYHWRMLSVDALLSLGLYHLDLWELAAAARYFQAVIAAAQDTTHQSWADKASLCLALVVSQSLHDPSVTLECGQDTRSLPTFAQTLADQAYLTITDNSRPEYTGRFAFFIQLLAQTYTHLRQAERATELYNRAIAFAEASHYIQVKARALIGLGQLSRQQRQEAQAIDYIHQALTLLQDLGAYGDLAEAHYQLGLTHQQSHQISLAQEHLTHAVQYYSDMQAPDQVAKVNTASDLAKKPVTLSS